MSKKLLIVLGLFVLMCSSLFAQTTITLTDPTVGAIGTALSVVPTLTWTHEDGVPAEVNLNGKYVVQISKNPSLSSPIEIEISGNPAAKTVTLNPANGVNQVLNYDTTYYWRVRQYNNLDVELDNPSAVGSFRTPKMSVVPYLTWTSTGTAGTDYWIRISENSDLSSPVLSKTIGSENRYYKVLDTEILKYNTTYYWGISRGELGDVTTQTSFTTKPLNIIEEIYQYSNDNAGAFTTVAPYEDIEIGTDRDIRYIAITDEFETLTNAYVNATFTALSSISDPTRQASKLQFLAPNADLILTTTATQSIVTRAFDILPADGATAYNAIEADNNDIKITSNETVTMQFQYGNEFVLNTNVPNPAVSAINVYSNSNYTDDEIVAHHMGNANLYIKFTTVAATVGASKKIIIKNLDNGYYLGNIYAYATAADQYRLHLTDAQINLLYTGITINRPVRISIYPVEQPTMKKDFIWTGKTPLITNSTTATFNSANYNLTQTITVTGLNESEWVRIVSNLDPVGFIFNPGRSVINLGVATDPTTNTIEAGVGGTVSATRFDGTVITTSNIVAQTYTPYTMVTPANFTTNADVYPRLSWTSAFSAERGEQHMTHYQVMISTSPTFAAHDPENANPALRVWTYTYTTTNTYLYPEIDLLFNKSYFWKVAVVPGGANSVPTNITDNNAWVFTTTPQAGYQVVGTIPENRTFITGNSPYILVNNPAIAAGKTLTIEENINVKFNLGAKLAINGNIVVNGSAGNVVTFTTDAASWQGLEFAGTNRDPLVVNEANEYVSGSLLDYVIIEKATEPISYLTGANFDVYIDNSLFKDNATGIDISEGSYVLNTTIEDFDDAGLSTAFAIKGGYYFDTVTIDGDRNPDDNFTGSGVITTNKNAIIKNSTIQNISGNAIVINSSATDGAPLIHKNTITGTGVNSSSIAIQAIKGATITENLIGNIGNADEAHRNTGYAIINGAYIAGNEIEQNGNGAILADEGATVINNVITNNPGYAIKNGLVIDNNTITNTTGEALASFRVTNAIEADLLARVSNNTINDVNGFSIKNGKTIFNNQIVFNVAFTPAIVGTDTTHYAIKASPGQNAKVEANTITRPIGYAILNGMLINNNEITGHADLTKSGAFGIKAEVGATVSNNEVTAMKGTSIENGSLIHNNVINQGFAGIKADSLAIITNNTLFKNTLSRQGYAINGGKIINFNSVTGFYTPEVPARNDFRRGRSDTRQEVLIHDLIFSEYLEEFRNNTIHTSTANGGSILNAVKANTESTPLAFTDNVFTNNKYSISQIRLSSKNMSILDNEITNNYDPINPGTTGGLLSLSGVTDGQGTALYVKLQDANAIMRRNLIKGHKGAVNGAALYIEAFDRDYKIIIEDENIITDNHALGTNAKGAAVYHKNGTVILGTKDASTPQILGNTITVNSVALPDPFVAAGSTIHTVNSFEVSYIGKMEIYRNIIAGNVGNWAIYGAPAKIHYNNIYDNKFVDELQDKNFYYTHNATHQDVTSNFWGSRSDQGQIDPSIYDDNESDQLGMVVYQPILSGPSEDTPGIVDNIQTVKIVLSLGDIDGNGILNLPTDSEILAVIFADDNNDYSKDFTEVKITNQSTGFFIQPLLQETAIASEKYYAGFTLTTNNVYNPEENKLPVTGGDIIRISSVKDPTKVITLMAALQGATSIKPYITEYNFGPWLHNLAEGDRSVKKFTFTNGGNEDLTLETPNAIVSSAPARFEVIQAPADGSVIPAGASFDVTVRYNPETPAPAPPGEHTANLTITFAAGHGTVHNRTITLIGYSIGSWANNYATEPWGTPAPLTNQMTIVANVTIDGADAEMGDIVGAFVVKGMKEELRGKAPVVNNNGLATIVVQTDINDEDIYFKVWDISTHTLYECPDATIVSSVTGGNIRAPHDITAMSTVNLSGKIVDDKAGPNDLPGVTLTNIHSTAEINPATNKPFAYTTDVNGDYFMQVWEDTKIILLPEKEGWTFVTSTADPVGTRIDPNDVTFTYTVNSVVETYTAGSVYYNADYLTEDNQGAIDAIDPLATPLDADHADLDFVGTIATYIVAGTLYLDTAKTIPLANTEITVTLNPGAITKTIITDAAGNFFFLVDSGTEVTSITVSQAQLTVAGFGDVQPIAPITLGPWTITEDKTDIELADDSNFKRKQIITLNPGWNLISFNVNFANNTPQQVFSAAHQGGTNYVTQVRTMDQVYDSTAPLTSSLQTIFPGKAYYVWNNHNAVVTLTVEGGVAKVQEIELLRDNWNLIGYTPPKPGQTRTMLENDSEIIQVNTLTEAYFYTDDPVGSSTLEFLNPGQGYWMKTADVATPKLNYSFPDYNNIIKSFEFRTLTNQSWAYGTIDNDYSGYPMAVGTVASNALVVGETYKVITLGTGDYTNAGAAVNNVGVIFTATATTNGQADGTVRLINGPKTINVAVSNGQAVNLTPTIDLDNSIFGGAPALSKIYNATQYAALLTDLADNGWDSFLDLVRTTGAALGGAFNFGADAPNYIIYSSQSLADDTNKQRAQIVVYQVNVDNTTATDTDRVLNSIAIVNNYGGGIAEKTYPAILTGTREFTIALPDDITLDTARITFSVNGSGLYDVLDGGDPTNPAAAGANQVTSGTFAYTTLDTEQLTLWVADIDGPIIDPAESYTVNIIKLPATSFDFRSAPETPVFAQTVKRSSSNLKSRESQDPFGVVNYKTNSHYVLGRISNNGAPVHSSYIVATYVGEELRGKHQVINYNGNTYIPILINTTTSNEPVTFKIWRDGEPVRTFDNTLMTIPGGTTGSIQNPYQLNMALTSSEDAVAPQYINELLPAYPNPFNPTTTIKFSLKDNQRASVVVYNIKGQRVTTLVDDMLEKGHHEILWNGTNSQGKQIGSGIYFIRMQTDNYSKVQKAVLIK